MPSAPQPRPSVATVNPDLPRRRCEGNEASALEFTCSGKRRTKPCRPMKNDLFAMFIFMAALVPAAAATGRAESSAPAQGAAEVGSDNGEAVLRKLLELSHEAKVSLSEAIAKAEKLHDGSRTVQIGFEGEGLPEYRVRTVRGGAIWENTIDARNGRIIGREASFSSRELSPDDRRDIDALKHVTQDLSEAVLYAEKAVAGKAVGGCLVDEDGTLNFAVVVVSDDRLKQVMLEAKRVDRHTATIHQVPRNGYGHRNPADFKPR
jgi:uncharacterized membrane protein YkoI